MDIHALKRLEDRVRTLEGVSPVLGSGNRDNEPCEAWAPDDPRAVDVLLERGPWVRSATVLNLDTCRGLGGVERPEAITGLDGLAIELDPKGAARVASTMRAEHGDTPAPREVARELLGLDEDQSRVLFDGPNWAGKARAWIQPTEAAQAVQHVRRDLPSEQVWAHLDRRTMVEQHVRERPDEYLDREARARVEHWVSSVSDLGYDPETGLPPQSLTGADLGAERQRIMEELRGLQAWDSIAATAEIDPSARIGRGVSIGEYVSVGRDAVIGDDVHLGLGVSVGDESRIESGVTVLDDTVIGDRCTVSVSVGERSVVGAECVLAHTEDSYDPSPDRPSVPGAPSFAYVPAGSQLPDRTILGSREVEPDWVSEGVPDSAKTVGRGAPHPQPSPPLVTGIAAEAASRGRGGRPL